MKTTSLIMTIMSALLSAFAINPAQDSSISRAGCTLIEKNRSAQFITFITHEGTSESPSGVWLRLRNNTNCAIIVETDDVSPARLNRLPNGGVRVERITTSEDGVRLPLHYLIQDTRRWRAPEQAYGWGDSAFTYEILAGQSVVFNVPLTRFKKGYDVAVPFNYVWEGSTSVGMGVGGVVHRVYFLAEELPKVVRRE